MDDTRQSAPDDFGRTFADKVMDGAVEPLISKWVDTCSPSKTDQAEIRQSYTGKIKQVAQEYSSSDQALADAKRLVEATADIIETDLPRDMVDEREEAEYEREEKSDLDIVRSKLRTFTRAIPSFVMASGHPSELNIDNIETVVNDDDFSSFFTDKEVLARGEKFTKDDFCVLRDGGDYEENGATKHFDGFFDKYVFNASIQEFAKKRRDLADYLRVDRREDIFSYIPPQRSNQIFTPRRVVNQMLDILEQYNPGIFSDPTLTFCDLYVKSGLYLAETAKRLFKGLVNAIPDENARIRHIFERQLYGFAPTRIIADIARNYVYGSYPVSSDNLVQRDLTDDFKKGENLDMKFDVVIGNPPYQEGNYQIYSDFYLQARKCANNICMIFPSGWQQVKTTNGLGKLNKSEVKHDKQIISIDNRQNVFDNVAGAEWTNIICWRRFYDNGLNGKQLVYTEGTNPVKIQLPLTKNDIEKPEEILSVVDKVDLRSEPKVLSIGSASKPYGFRADPIDNPAKYNLTVSNVRTPTHSIRLFGNKARKRSHVFIERSKLIKESPMLEKYKLFVPKAWGNMDERSGYIGGSFSEILVADPLDCCSEMYIEFGPFETKNEAENAKKYFYTKFFRAVFYRDKVSQNTAKETYRSIPMQDFTTDSDINWTKSIPEIDRQLYNKYGLDDREIRFIEEKVKEME